MLSKSQQSSFPDRTLEMWNALSLAKLPSLFLFLAWLCSYLFYLVCWCCDTLIAPKLQFVLDLNVWVFYIAMINNE